MIASGNGVGIGSFPVQAKRRGAQVRASQGGATSARCKVPGEPSTSPRQSQVQDPSGAARTAISIGLVSLLKEHYGVGPTQTKTYYNDDLVVCLLRGGFTRASGRCSKVAGVTRSSSSASSSRKSCATASWR